MRADVENAQGYDSALLMPGIYPRPTCLVRFRILPPRSWVVSFETYCRSPVGKRDPGIPG